jgi:hypothetical protein
LGPARETLAVEGLPLPREVVRIVLAELGHEAGMVGAARRARDARRIH